MSTFERFLIACKENNIQQFEILLKNVDFRKNNYQPFRVACEYGNIDIVKKLLQKENDIHNIFIVVNSHKSQGLRRAAKNGHAHIVSLLINCGAKIHFKNNQAIELAKKYNRISVVEILNNFY